MQRYDITISGPLWCVLESMLSDYGDRDVMVERLLWRCYDVQQEAARLGLQAPDIDTGAKCPGDKMAGAKCPSYQSR